MIVEAENTTTSNNQQEITRQFQSDMERMYRDSMLYDVNLVIGLDVVNTTSESTSDGDGEDPFLFACGSASAAYARLDPMIQKRTLRAHRAVLASRCAFFRAMFCNERMCESRRNTLFFPEKNFDDFRILVDYFYTARINIDHENAFSVLKLSDELGVQAVKDTCTRYVKENITEENVFDVLEEARFHNFLELAAFCTSFIEHHAQHMFQMSCRSFRTISRDTLIELLKSDKIRLSELEIFLSVLEWAKWQVKHNLHSAQLAATDPEELSPQSRQRAKRNLLPLQQQHAGDNKNNKQLKNNQIALSSKQTRRHGSVNLATGQQQQRSRSPPLLLVRDDASSAAASAASADAISPSDNSDAAPSSNLDVATAAAAEVEAFSSSRPTRTRLRSSSETSTRLPRPSLIDELHSAAVPPDDDGHLLLSLSEMENDNTTTNLQVEENEDDFAAEEEEEEDHTHVDAAESDHEEEHELSTDNDATTALFSSLFAASNSSRSSSNTAASEGEAMSSSASTPCACATDLPSSSTIMRRLHKIVDYTHDKSFTQRLRDELADILQHVRFPILTPHELYDAVEVTQVVPQELLLEAYRSHALANRIEAFVSPRHKVREGSLFYASGVLENVPLKMLRGWNLCYHAPYSDKTNEAVFDRVRPGTKMLVAARHRNSPNLALCAMGRTSKILRETTENETTFENGVYWYIWRAHAFGFSPVQQINLGSADLAHGTTRLSWHLTGRGGYRIGEVKGLNDSDQFEKMIFYS